MSLLETEPGSGERPVAVTARKSTAVVYKRIMIFFSDNVTEKPVLRPNPGIRYIFLFFVDFQAVRRDAGDGGRVMAG